MTIVEQAAQIAVQAHRDQVRKTDGSPYIVHPFMCVLKLTRHGFSATVIAAALVHDVLEDTEVTEDALRTALGDTVADIVCAVSEDKSLVWEERKKQYIETIRTAPIEVKAVSVADKIHNTESMLAAYREQGQMFWTKFNRGRDEQLWFLEALIDTYKTGWDHPLINEYEQLIKQLCATV